MRDEGRGAYAVCLRRFEACWNCFGRVGIVSGSFFLARAFSINRQCSWECGWLRAPFCVARVHLRARMLCTVWSTPSAYLRVLCSRLRHGCGAFGGGNAHQQAGAMGMVVLGTRSCALPPSCSEKINGQNGSCFPPRSPPCRFLLAACFLIVFGVRLNSLPPPDSSASPQVPANGKPRVTPRLWPLCLFSFMPLVRGVFLVRLCVFFYCTRKVLRGFAHDGNVFVLLANQIYREGH